MPDELDPLIKDVQRNCDITDSNHAQTYGICTYLIKMREYFLWRNKKDFTTEIQNAEILPWISDLEEFWETVEEEPFGKIRLNEDQYDPFDTETLNNLLVPRQLVYSGGFSQGGIPSFFLGELLSDMTVQGYRVLIAGKELARGLFGPPAMLQDKTIFIRKQALKQLIWARYEEWRFVKRKNTMKTAFDCYDFENDPDGSLSTMTEKETRSLILHEIGEGLMNKEFGPQWREMILDFAFSKTEIVLRAVKDLAADSLTTLPALFENDDTPSIHFYFANFSDMRKELFPELFEAYKRWADSGDLGELRALIEINSDRWSDLGKEMTRLYQASGKNAAADMTALVGQ